MSMSVSASHSTTRKPVVESGLRGINDDVDVSNMQIATTQHGVLLDTDIIIPPNQPGGITRFKRRVIRQKEVPYKRQVKVPIITKKVVPTTFSKRIKTKKLVEVEHFEEIDETYTVLEEVTKTRKKSTWVEVEEDEEYMKKVPVYKTRLVKKPVKRVEEHEDFQVVTVPGTKMVEIRGWRIDEIEEKRWVEIDEYEVFELLPHQTGRLVKGRVENLGLVGSSCRKTGDLIYARGDLRDAGLPFDSMEADETVNKEREQLTRARLYVNSRGGVSHADPESLRGYTSLEEWNKNFITITTTKTIVREGFNLQKCLAYVRKSLIEQKADCDVDATVAELEARWCYVDTDEGGRISLEELRTAVWEREEDNKGQPLPKGRLPNALQAVVDNIHHGTGGKKDIDFWSFTNFILGPEELMTGAKFIGEPNYSWAHASN